jgi:DedD protein
MSPDRDSGRVTQDDLDVDERDESPRSIFSALWFRVLLAALVLGVVAAVAVPYVIDSQALKFPVAKSAVTPPSGLATASTSAVTPAPTAPTSEPSTAAAETATSAAPPAETAAPAPPAAPAPVTARPKTAAPPAKTEKSEKPVPSKPASAKSPTMVAKANETAKPATKAEKSPPRDTESTKAETPVPRSAEATKAAETPAGAKAASAGGGKAYWVQVGAFKDAETAKRVAARLREGGLRVEESSTTLGSAAPRASAAAPAADRYDVLVSGASPADVEAKLAPKGFKGETTPTGVVVRPSLALREAVTLSRELADAGLSVQVRRIGPPAAAPAAAPAPAPAAGQTLYRVRVGGFADRAGAVDAMKQLEAKGYKPFIARGNE